MELQRPDEALASYERAIALEPHFAEAFYGRGNAFRQLKRPDEALASYAERSLSGRTIPKRITTGVFCFGSSSVQMRLWRATIGR